MNVIDKLFRFPILMINMQDEERKNRLGLPSDDSEEVEVITGEAEYPYFDFIGIEDRWIPNSESLKNAFLDKFDACVVKFANVPQMLVPWNKGKFKKEFSKFIQTIEKKEDEAITRVLKFTPEQLSKIFSENIKDTNEKDTE